MKVEIRSSFVKAAKKLPAALQQKVAEIIIQMEKAKTIRELAVIVIHLRKQTKYAKK